ncbi:AMP-binding protein [Streptomyces albospinus]|uniref:AMP-binding protein n=1 Tax=Streptomyces albospinus TaxID=285515 RepID=A0ABQ2V2S1_9ACTN|nr:class I adenylate-forming enzyme family protein [Streptomyces albospinus]GGU65137.1 AMP-binding protein [Streptomyces albospinus]
MSSATSASQRADGRDTGTSAWVDELLLAGPDEEPVLQLGQVVDGAALRSTVQCFQQHLENAGLVRGGSVVLRLPPSLAYIGHLLAAWRIGAQVTVVDHRLTGRETDTALNRIRPQVSVTPDETVTALLRGYVDVTARYDRLAGVPAQSNHALVQLSSGSTGSPKIIGRTVSGLVEEMDRYRSIEGMPGRGERIVQLSSIAHAFGMVGGLLHSLHTGVLLTLPERVSAASIVEAVACRPESATLLGVPFHFELLTARGESAHLPQLARAVTGGERIRPDIAQRFTELYGIGLGECYGTTETGLVALDVLGRHRPAVGPPAPGVRVRIDEGELLIGTPSNPYLSTGQAGPWSEGWLHTRDAATHDPSTGAVTIVGRLDSQISIGGLKVDLTEVEQTLVALPGVREAVALFDRRITAYLGVAPGTDPDHIHREMRSRLAVFKRPRALYLMPELPRTSSGKLVRSQHTLQTAVARSRRPGETD